MQEGTLGRMEGPEKLGREFWQGGKAERGIWAGSAWG